MEENFEMILEILASLVIRASEQISFLPELPTVFSLLYTFQ
jgi:hypothetical protein